MGSQTRETAKAAFEHTMESSSALLTPGVGAALIRAPLTESIDASGVEVRITATVIVLNAQSPPRMLNKVTAKARRATRQAKRAKARSTEAKAGRPGEKLSPGLLRERMKRPSKYSRRMLWQSLRRAMSRI